MDMRIFVHPVAYLDEKRHAPFPRIHGYMIQYHRSHMDCSAHFRSIHEAAHVL